MRLFFIPRTGFLRRIFLFCHLTGIAAGLLILGGVALLAGEAVITPATVGIGLVVGYLAGTASYIFVQKSLATQLKRQLALLSSLSGEEQGGNVTLEALLHSAEAGVAQMEDVVKTVMVTADDIQHHFQVMLENTRDLADRAGAGIEAAKSSGSDVAAMEQKQQQVMEQMQLLADSSREESALSHQLSASLGEMAEAVDISSSRFIETSSTVEEMAASVREVAAQAEEVGHSVEVTARDMDSIGDALEKIRSEAHASVEASEAVRRDAGQGLEVVSSSLAEMERIEEHSGRATRAMQRLAQQTGEVETIIEVIRDLVSDTELLAFNAAIIAAQAGDEGRGFSVVAVEIRDLADRTASSAGDIHRIIQGIGSDTGEVTEAVDATAKQISLGKDSLLSTGQALRQIVASSGRAAGATGDIARLTETESARAGGLLEEAARNLRAVQAIVRAMKEQESGIGRIEHGVAEMKAATDRIGRGMEEQVRANRAFDRGLLEREEQALAVNEATSFQMSVTRKVAEHFSSSTERLHGNLRKTEQQLQTIDSISDATRMLRQLVEGFKPPEPPAP